jgi:hypothetical protein
MQSGTVNVDGKLDASAPNGGNGGFIETSAAHVKVNDNARITTSAPQGLTGSWLIDPVDFTIAATGGDMTGAALTTSLGSGNVVIQSTSGGSGSAGDINVNDAVSWSSSKLTLNAQNTINIRANLSVTSSGSLAMEFGQGAPAAGNTSNFITMGGVVNLFVLATFTTKQGSDGAVKSYLVINSLGTAGSTNKKSLQGMSGGMASNYVLGANIDATATSGWNSGAGFLPIGDGTTPYTGTFNGLGHTISNLTINRPTTDRVGLFGKVDTGGSVLNVGLVGGSVTGHSMVGGLVGENAYGTISNSYTTGAVNGGSYTGGLVGNNYGGAISNSYATGAVSGSGYTGGLVGSNNYGGSTISNSYATGTVNSTGSAVGGLAGRNNGTVSNSYASGAVNSTATTVGGLIGYNASTISNSYASGAVSGSSSVGGLAGFNNGTVTASFWDTTTSGKATSAGGVGMTTANMQTQANFTSATAANGNVNPAWDMANTWTVYGGHTSPLLRSFMTALTVTANNATKTYNGLTYSGGNGVTYSTTPNGNLLGTLSYGGTSQGATNAGTYAITGSGLYSNQQGYLISYADGALTVNKADLTLGGTRTYDGTTTVAGSVLTATGVAGETFAITGSGDTTNLASKNVQTGSTLATITGLALGTSGNGGLSANYNTLSTTGSAVSITKADLTLSTTDVTKTYDGTLAANGTATVSSGTLFGSDSLSGGTFAFTDANAGSNKTVTATGVTVADGNGGGNYNVAYADNTSSTINNKAVLTTTAPAPGETIDSTPAIIESTKAQGAVTNAVSASFVAPTPPARVQGADDRGTAPTQATGASSASIQPAGLSGPGNLNGLNVTLVGPGIKLPSDMNGAGTADRKQ